MSNREQLYAYKGNRCGCCGLNVAEMVARYGTFHRMFNFHHIDPDAKDCEYKRLMSQRLSRRQMDEIDKCALLCVQCHATLHAQEIRGTLNLSVQVEQRLVRQTVKGWVKADIVECKLFFITNEPYLLHPYEVTMGSQPSRILCLIEIETVANLHTWMREMDQHKLVEIYSLRERRTVMRMEHVDAAKVRVTQSIGFPVTMLEFFPDSGPEEFIYFRNGIVLSSSGDVRTKGEITYEMDLTVPTTVEFCAPSPDA